MGILNGKCDRCGAKVRALRMSMFCTELCCAPCLSKEKKHPLYEQAKQAEQEQVKLGNMNFPGIGKPDDL